MYYTMYYVYCDVICTIKNVVHHLITEFINKLIKAEVNLGLHLVVQELFTEHSQGVERGVVVQIQGVEDGLHVGTILELTGLTVNTTRCDNFQE